MKYSEFKREVEKLGCEVYDRGCDLFIKRNTHTILTVNKNREFEFDNEWNKWSGIGEIKSPLFDLAYQLAKTPLAVREEEKKYYLISEAPFLPDCGKYYNLKAGETFAYFGSDSQMGGYQTIFTESEVAKMDLTGLEKVEVEG